jgi:hypothetical protein
MLKILSEVIVYANVTRVFRSRHVENIEWRNCYVNVTWVVHVENIEWDDCLCECLYVNVTWVFEAVMLIIKSDEIVYANVTRVFRSRHVENVEWDDCLCECYMSFRSRHVDYKEWWNCLCRCYTSSSKSPCWKYWVGWLFM